MKQHPPVWRPLGATGVRLPEIPMLWWRIAGASFALLFVLIWPFFPDNPWGFIGKLQDAANVENYRVNSFWAYNFWGMFGFFKADSLKYAGLAYQWWGLLLYGVSMGAILYAFRRAGGTGMLALGTALSVLAFYVFVTRMHERYIFPAFLPLLLACILLRSPLLWASFLVLGVVHFVNLYHVYIYYQNIDGHNELFIQSVFDRLSEPDFYGLGMEAARVLSRVVFGSFLFVMGVSALIAARRRRTGAT
jgi:hypothetical protein